MLNLPGVQAVEKPRRDDVGRPTDYRAEYAVTARKLCELGATDKDLAECFGVSERTIHKWRVSIEEFAIASRVGKVHADEKVKRAFFKVAEGYEYDEEFITKDGRKDVRRVVVPPNPSAIVKWLSARTPEFRETQRVEHSGSVKTDSIDLKGLTDDQLSKYMAFMESVTKQETDDD